MYSSTNKKHPSIHLEIVPNAQTITTTLGTSETPSTAAPVICTPFSSVPKTHVLPIELIPHNNSIIVTPPLNQKLVLIRFQIGISMNVFAIICAWIPLMNILLLFLGQVYLWINYSTSDTHLFHKNMARKSIRAAWTFLVIWCAGQIVAVVLFAIVVVLIIILITVR